MSSDIQKLNISRLRVQLETEAWNVCPGQWISYQAESERKAQILFDNFVTKKMPEALKLLAQLNDTRHLSSIHLPLRITSIFLIYVTEQIELYQNQTDARDLEVDQKLQLFKEAFAKERYLLFTHNPKWANAFFEDLKPVLMKADVLAADFDKTVATWLKLISIVHVGDINLASCFQIEAKTIKLFPKKRVFAEVRRDELEASFSLLISQLSQDLKWIVLKIGEKMLFPEELEVQALFFAATDPENLLELLKKNDAYINAASVIQDDFKVLLRNFLSLDLTNNEKINDCLANLMNIITHLNCYGDLSLCVNAMRQLDINKKTTICGPESYRIKITKENFPQLQSLTEDRQECHLLMDCYLTNPCLSLINIMTAIMSSNLAIKELHKEGKNPHLCTQSLLPPPVLQCYNESVFQELCSSPIPEPIPKKKGVKNNASKIIPKKEEIKISSNVNQELTAVPILFEKPIETKVINPLERLRRQLFAIFQAKPMISIRQALWHLDTIISIQDALNTSGMNKENSLPILNMTAGSAQKLLEQAYRFCLEIRGITPPVSHNLKDYHKAHDNTSYPDIVNKLYLANHWTRYFYLENERWSFSTQVVKTPTLVQDFVDIAEGAPLRKNPSLTQSAQDIIEKTRILVEKILPKLDIAFPDSFLAQDVPIKVNLPFNPNRFNEIKNSLGVFLAKTSFSHHHPVYLNLKQGIAAIAILKESLQRIKQAKTPRELASWTALCTQQIQETLENILHAIEFLKEGETSTLHDLKKLSSQLGLEMGPLADACHQLSYKSRYPAENLSDGLGAQLIDDIETFRQYPDILESFQPVSNFSMLWKQPTKNLSLPDTMKKLSGLLESTLCFLEMQAIPALLAQAAIPKTV